MYWGDKEEEPLPDTPFGISVLGTPIFFTRPLGGRANAIIFSSSSPSDPQTMCYFSSTPHPKTLVRVFPNQTSFLLMRKIFLHFIFTDKDAEWLSPNLTANKWWKQVSDPRNSDWTSVRAQRCGAEGARYFYEFMKMSLCSLVLYSEELYSKIHIF